MHLTGGCNGICVDENEGHLCDPSTIILKKQLESSLFGFLKDHRSPCLPNVNDHPGTARSNSEKARLDCAKYWRNADRVPWVRN